MYKLVIDLEMCRVGGTCRRNYKYAHETIQIGAVLLDERFVQIATLCQYVNPSYGMLDHFIENMTGIRNADLKGAPKLEEALEHLLDWIGHREYRVYAWSASDRNQLLHEIKAKDIKNERIADFVQAERWIDYQQSFRKRFKLNRDYSLEEALMRADIDPEGHFHDGLDDAANTGKLIRKLELQPDYQLTKAYELLSSDQPLSCSFGDLLAKLQISAEA